MRAFWSIPLLVTAGKTVAQTEIGSKGYYNISTGAFNLELDAVTQVCTGLNAMAGVNSGDSEFNFLLPTPGRTQSGNYVSLLILRFRIHFPDTRT